MDFLLKLCIGSALLLLFLVVPQAIGEVVDEWYDLKIWHDTRWWYATVVYYVVGYAVYALVIIAFYIGSLLETRVMDLYN